jgi:hypothetical protein
MTMTRCILEILSFVVHFHKENSKSYVSIIVMQSKLWLIAYFIRRIQVFHKKLLFIFFFYDVVCFNQHY